MMWLANNWRNLIWFALVLCVVQLAYSTRDYQDMANKAASYLKSAIQTLTDMQTRQRDVAALYAKYIGELANAKSKLDALEQCVSSNKCELRINATCPKPSTSITRLDDDVSARLTDAAQRDYFTLKKPIVIITTQLTGLQQYIKEQCLD